MRLRRPRTGAVLALALAPTVLAATTSARPSIAAEVAATTATDTVPEALPTRRPPGASAPADTRNPLRQATESRPEASAPGVDADSHPDGVASPRADDGDSASRPPTCGVAGCTGCSRKLPVCKPKWEDKKTKRPVLSIGCEWECVRPWDSWHDGNCCEEKTTPCGDVRVRKKLYKTEEEHCERVLKYEVEMKPAAPCRAPASPCGCLGCRCLGPGFQRLFGWCH